MDKDRQRQWQRLVEGEREKRKHRERIEGRERAKVFVKYKER